MKCIIRVRTGGKIFVMRQKETHTPLFFLSDIIKSASFHCHAFILSQTATRIAPRPKEQRYPNPNTSQPSSSCCTQPVPYAASGCRRSSRQRLGAIAHGTWHLRRSYEGLPRNQPPKPRNKGPHQERPMPHLPTAYVVTETTLSCYAMHTLITQPCSSCCGLKQSCCCVWDRAPACGSDLKGSS